MGNCCGAQASKNKKPLPDSPNREETTPGGGAPKVILLAKLSSRGEQSISEKYNLGNELGRGEFGITYLECNSRHIVTDVLTHP